MNLYHRTRLKLYFWIAKKLAAGNPADLPVSFKNKRNLFLYFDYEREFGGHDVGITDKDIYRLLDELDKLQIKTSWFTVGKIFEHYPESIREIVKRGHELASHSYAHKSPYDLSCKDLERDFMNFHLYADPLVRVKGYHSPNSKWSLSLGRELTRHGYLYDVTGRYNKTLVTRIHCGKHKSFLRLTTLGDDWDLFKEKADEYTTLKHYKKLFEKLQPGQLAGLGAHPWVLLSNPGILKGYILFLNYLKEQQDLTLDTALNFVKKIKERDETL
jgi:peptidoglycan-N-acetylglucosamine deacetylase